MNDEQPNRRGFLAGTLAAGLVAAPTHSAEPASGTKIVNPRVFSFIGGKTGSWTVTAMTPIVGEGLPQVQRIDLVNAVLPNVPDGATWVLPGIPSNQRYTTRPELDAMTKKQAALGRPESKFCALIPIRKNAKWWALTQEERREIFEDQSKHISANMKYLPGVARKLYHCRDLSTAEPFDFLTQFDFSAADITAFDDMLKAMRATPEWTYVDRELDIRMTRTGNE